MKPIDEYTFKRAYIICVGNERLQIESDDSIIFTAPKTTIARYHQNGVIAGQTVAPEFHPQLNKFWSSVVLKVLDASIASPFSYTIFILDPKVVHKLVEHHNDKTRLEEESWTRLERARESSFHNIWDFNTTSLIYLETNDDPQASLDDNSILVQILKHMNCYSKVASIAQNYADLLLCRVSIGKEWDQMAAINIIKSPPVSECVCIPDSVFDILRLMNACKVMRTESASLAEHKFVKTHARYYFDLVRKGRHDLINLYDNEILTDIESWQLHQSDAYDLTSSITLDQRLVCIRTMIDNNSIVDCSPGLEEPRHFYNVGVLTKLHSTLEKSTVTITRIRNTTEEKRSMIMALLTEFVSLRMHSEATNLSRRAIWISVVALIVGIVL